MISAELLGNYLAQFYKPNSTNIRGEVMDDIFNGYLRIWTIVSLLVLW